MNKISILSFSSLLMAGLLNAQEFKTSDFFEREKSPTIPEIKSKVAELKTSLSSAELTEAQKAAFSALEKSLEVVVTPAKYKVAYSQGPAFREAALAKQIALHEENDLPHALSYLYENWDNISQVCGAVSYNDPDVDIEFDDVVQLVSEEPTYVWNSIKENANDPSVAYILYTVLDLKVIKDDSGELKDCKYPYSYSLVAKELNPEGKVKFLDETAFDLEQLIKFRGQN